MRLTPFHFLPFSCCSQSGCFQAVCSVSPWFLPLTSFCWCTVLPQWTLHLSCQFLQAAVGKSKIQKESQKSLVWFPNRALISHIPIFIERVGCFSFVIVYNKRYLSRAEFLLFYFFSLITKLLYGFQENKMNGNLIKSNKKWLTFASFNF